MRVGSRLLTFTFIYLIVLIVTIAEAELCFGRITSGQMAPVFSSKDIDGNIHELSAMKDQPMVMLYFFDVESRPSQEGLLSLDRLAKQYENTDLVVWAITLSPREKVADFIARIKPSFPILLDTTGVSDLYQARLVLPTVCVLGPSLRVLDYFQGGGKTTEIMLVRLAERKLQRKQTAIAKAISEQVVKKNPQNPKAKAVGAYAALEEGNLKEAEKIFKDLSKETGQGEILGKEGLTGVYARKGQAEKAFRLAKEVERKAPDRSFVHVIKGDLFYSQNKKKEAEQEYRVAVEKKAAMPHQKALAFNQFGRFFAGLGNYRRARELYDQAVDINPYYIEAMSNKGITYEKEHKWAEALDTYTQALSLDKNDDFAAVLARKAQEMLAIQRDVEQKKRVDKLVRELADRYRSQKQSVLRPEDMWTSRPLVLTFVDFVEKGGLAERDGFSTVFFMQLSHYLNASGRVRVVERVLIERLLEELNLSASDLTDPETALKLGRVLAAKLIGTGSLYYMPAGTLLSMRLIDTETSEIPAAFTRQVASKAPLEKELHWLNQEILKTVILKYPLRGYVVQATGDQVMINIGSRQGVVLGTKFEVLEEPEAIQYKGRLLRSSPKSIGLIEIIRVEPDLCHCRVLSQERPFHIDDKVKEKIENVT